MKVLDKKAQQILFRTYWSDAGWKSKPETSSEDFDYALNAGYMFNPVSLSHDEIVDRVINITNKIVVRRVSDAFLTSLSSRRLDLRSALGSFAVARHFPKHEFFGERMCNICGIYLKSSEEDLNVLNFERLKWGGVRHLSPLYISFDLEQFSKTVEAQPAKQDFEVFNAIIETTKSLDKGARPRDLEKAISKIIGSNQAEREGLIQILGYCGILQPQKQKGFFDSFVNYNEREVRPVNKIDWEYPVSWWRAVDGVNENALTFFFPQLKTVYK